MDDSAPPPEMDVIAGGRAGGGDWGYLGSDGMAGNSSQASPFPTGILSTPASASMHLPKDPAPFDLNADPSPSPIAPAPHAFHNLGSSIPFHGPAQFLGAPPQPPPPSPEDQKGGFLVTPTLPITMGMGWDDDEEIEQSLDASSMPITAASLENAAGAEPGEGSGAGGSGSGSGRGNKTGMPSKNLMAERLRRKKINERLFILRSVVPKITKMSRASIVSDAIEYMKELKQKAHDLQIEIESASNSSLVGPTTASFPTPNGQPSTVDVRMREGHAVNIHMFCASKPGIAVSTVKALDNLGLDIEQATISCFEGFAMDVFRAQRCVDGPGPVPVPEDIKAALMRSAGPQNWQL